MSHDIFKHLLANATGATIAELLTLPICTVKTNYQTRSFNSVTNCVKSIYTTRGLYGFFSIASYPAVISQIASTCSKFTFYRFLQTYRQTPKADILNNSINGALSGFLGSLLTHPIDVVKVHLQRNESIRPKWNTDLIGRVKFMYSGYTPTIGKNVALYALLLPCQDFYKSKVNNTLIAAIMTTVTVTTIIQPLDYLRVRGITKQGLFLGYNPLNYYKGFWLNLSRSIPHFFITIYISELIMRK